MSRPNAPSHRLLDLIYDAATDPEKWENALLEIADATDSVGCHIFGADSKPGSKNAERYLAFSHLARIDEDLFRLFGERHLVSELSVVMDNSPEGQFIRSDEIIPLRKFQRTPLFDEILRPQGISHTAMVSLVSKNDFRAGFVVSRNERNGPHDEQALRFFSQLYPHVRRSLALTFRLEGYSELQNSRFDILDRLATGIVLLDRLGRVVYANAAARRSCTDEYGLKLRQSGITAGSYVHSTKLKDVIQKANMGYPAQTVSVPRSDGGLLTIIVSSVRGRDVDRFADASFPDASIILFIIDPANRGGVPAEAIMEAYGLTQAEAKVAVAIASGCTIQAAALTFGSSPNTIKTHLRRVFEKTGSSRQADLARLIAGFGTIDTTQSD